MTDPAVDVAQAAWASGVEMLLLGCGQVRSRASSIVTTGGGQERVCLGHILAAAPGGRVGSRWTNRLPINLDPSVDIPLLRNGVDTEWEVSPYGPGAKVIAAGSRLVVTDSGWVEPSNNMRFYVVLEVDGGLDSGRRFVTEYADAGDPEPMRHALASIVPDDSEVAVEADSSGAWILSTGRT